MSRRSVLWLLFVIVGSCQASISYKWVSKTLSGEPCMSSCVNGNCFVDHHLNSAACTIDYLAGVPVYRTASVGFSYCLSNCGKWGGYNYMWCYTTEKYHWDYCNDEVWTPGINEGRDIYGRRCVDACGVDLFSEGKCYLESQEYVTCSRAGFIPVHSCLAIFGQTEWLDRMYFRDDETRDEAAAVYSKYGTVDNITTFPAGSPYRFVATTTVNNANNQPVLLPLILEAHITDVVYAPRGDGEVTREGVENVNRMYNAFNSTYRPSIHVGHLLAYSNGGTNDLFNYAGQTATLNTGPYKTMENAINNWLRAGSVDFWVVVVYDGTRPKKFHVKLTFYNKDGSVHSNCLDMVFLNN